MGGFLTPKILQFDLLRELVAWIKLELSKRRCLDYIRTRLRDLAWIKSELGIRELAWIKLNVDNGGNGDWCGSENV